jgi:hypothetical protein
MTNLIQDFMVGFNQDINDELDDVEFHLPPEPHFEVPEELPGKRRLQGHPCGTVLLTTSSSRSRTAR